MTNNKFKQKINNLETVEVIKMTDPQLEPSHNFYPNMISNNNPIPNDQIAIRMVNGQEVTTNMRELVVSNYQIEREIGSGSFGNVYLAEHPDGHQVAVKVEDIRKNNRMKNEYKIYRYLRNKNFHAGIPEIYDFIRTPEYNIMVMELLGPNLEDIFNDHNKKFSLGTVYLLAIQILHQLENLHELNYIHRDIKPSNFLINRNINIEQVYIMDFGLSKKYIYQRKHIPLKDDISFVGTVRYASNNIHMKFEPSRRDDLESLGYMFVYFLKGKLPWQGIRKKMGKEYMAKVSEIKLCTPLSRLCEGLPKCFKEYMAYCRGLRFCEKPNYEMLRNLFVESSKKQKIILSYEWCKNSPLVRN